MAKRAEAKRSSRSGMGRTFVTFGSDKDKGVKLEDIRERDYAQKKAHEIEDSIQRAKETWKRCDPSLDPSWLGRTFEMNGKTFEVIGAYFRDDETQIVCMNGERLAHLGIAFISGKMDLLEVPVTPAKKEK